MNTSNIREQSLLGQAKSWRNWRVGLQSRYSWKHGLGVQQGFAFVAFALMKRDLVEDQCSYKQHFSHQKLLRMTRCGNEAFWCFPWLCFWIRAEIGLKFIHESELWKSKAGVLVYKDRGGLKIDLATGQNWFIKGKGPSPPPPPSPPPLPPEKIDRINMTPPPPPWNWLQLKGNWFEGGAPLPPPPLELIRGGMLGMVLECHEGTIGYDRLLLKDCHVLVVHNFIETGNSHEHKCNRHFRKLLARLRDIHSKDSWHSCTTDITSYTEVLTLDTLAGSQFQLIFTTELLGMVFACHERVERSPCLSCTQFYWNRKLPRTQMQQALSQAFGTFARYSLRHSHALFGTAFEV